MKLEFKVQGLDANWFPWEGGSKYHSLLLLCISVGKLNNFTLFGDEVIEETNLRSMLRDGVYDLTNMN